PGVPGQPHPGQGRDLLAAQPGRAPPAAGGQAHLLRRNAFAATTQELGQLYPSAFGCAGRAHPVTSSTRINSQTVTPINLEKNTPTWPRIPEPGLLLDEEVSRDVSPIC